MTFQTGFLPSLKKLKDILGLMPNLNSRQKLKNSPNKDDDEGWIPFYKIDDESEVTRFVVIFDKQSSEEAPSVQTTACWGNLPPCLPGISSVPLWSLLQVWIVLWDNVSIIKPWRLQGLDWALPVCSCPGSQFWVLHDFWVFLQNVRHTDAQRVCFFWQFGQ